MNRLGTQEQTFFRHFPDRASNNLWTWAEAWVFAKQKNNHFDFLEAGHFYAILVSDLREVCTDALKHASIIVDGIMSYLSLRRPLHSLVQTSGC